MSEPAEVAVSVSADLAAGSGCFCKRCGISYPPGTHRCQCWLTNNKSAVTTGLYAPELPVDLRHLGAEITTFVDQC